ncbi:MAG: hypothetical protein JXR68_03265 [Bacteroidales bacterium]|nr:hypothetical protein [Bacteroidales bacterium]
MEKFDIKESWLVKLNNNFQEQKEQTNPKDLKFFNVDILLDLARITQKHSYECEECEKNKDLLMDLSMNINTQINTIEGRRNITKKLDIVTIHLRKTHKMYITRYISSIYTIIFLSVGILIGVALGYLLKNNLFYILLSSATGLILGSLIGGLKEKSLKKNGQTYGKF